MRPTVKMRGKVNTANVKRAVKRGTKAALPGAGVIVQRAARKQFSHRNVKSTPQWQEVGRRQGLPVVAMTFRPPKSGRVTSWKNPRGRGATTTGFLRTLIKFEVEERRESVVIGPTDAATWLNRLHEFGGSGRQILKTIGLYRPGGKQRNSLLEKFPPPASALSGRRGGKDSGGRFLKNIGRAAYVGIWVDPAHTRRRTGTPLASRTARVPAGQYMGKGLATVRERLAEQWRNRIYGP